MEEYQTKRLSDLEESKDYENLYTLGYKVENGANKSYQVPLQQVAESYNKSSMFTGAIMNKGMFTSTDEALLAKDDKPFTIIACFVVPDTSEGSRMIFHDGYGTPDESFCRIYGDTKVYGLRVDVKGLATRSDNQSLPVGSLAQVAVSYIPDGTLTVCFNDRVIVNESPAYTREATPKETTLGGYSYEPFNAQTTIISFRKFDFAMTADQLVEAWNGGHPESWRVPDMYRNGAEGARCILDLIPESLTPTVWRDVSGQGHDLTYTPYGDNPIECGMDYVRYETVESNYKKNVLYGRQTAALVGGYAGYFMSDSPALILPDQPMTLIVVFKIGMSGTAIVYDVNTTSAGVTPYGEYIDVESGNFVRVSMRGGGSFSKNLPNTKLCMAAISYAPDRPLLIRINEHVYESDGVPDYANPYTPQHVRLGGWSTSYEEVTIISVRRFDFAMTREQLEEAWNGGHPERWRVPDAFLTIGRRWEDSTYTSGNTYFISDTKMEVTNRIPADNGFSGQYQRFGIGTASRIGIYNGFLNDLRRSELKRAWKIEFEYRADAEVILVSNGTDAEPDLRLEANTGNAKRVVFTTLPGKQIALKSTGTYLEIATVKMEQAKAILDLNPHGLTPTVWHDMSSGHNDLHFYRMTATVNSPEVCALSYEEHGFLDTITGDKAPDMNPQFTSQEYLDTTAKTTYKAFGTSSAADWVLQ